MKAAIVADNYKVKRFEKELTKAGFDDVEKKAFTETTTTLTINAPCHRKKDLEKLCKKIENHFRNRGLN